MEEQNGKLTYLMCDGNLYKIGKSRDPEKRVKEIKTANPYAELVCYGSGVTEKYLHILFFQKRKRGEWFNLSESDLNKCKRLIIEGESNKGERFFGKEKPELDIDGRKITSKYCTLSDSTLKSRIEATKESVDLNKKYKISFGKHTNTKLVDMTSDSEYDYCVWFLESYSKTLSKGQKRKDRKYKAFSWWVRVGYKEYMQNENL